MVTKSVEETKEEFIKKYRAKYNNYLVPAWKSFELLTFRPLINIFRALKDKADRNKISYFFGLNNEVFVSWLESLVYIRNICAHHARLWNIQLMIQPEKVKKPNGIWVSTWHNYTQSNEKLRCYAISCILAFLLDRINPHHTFKKDLKQLFEKYAEVDKAHMGFPNNWQEEPLWQ
jgi:abortive infection bacteriophage resistance protein